jgi:hypothetical protein
MNLKHLTDQVLIEDTKLLVFKERDLLVKLLHHLKEIDHRKLYSDLGYSSLFSYMTKGLGYSDSAAGRRIQAARLLKSHPEIETKIQAGALNLTHLNQVAFALKNDTEENQKSLLKKIEHLSSDETKKEFFKQTGKNLSQKDFIKLNSENSYELKITIDEETHDLIKELKGLSQNQELNILIKTALKTHLELKKKKKFALILKATPAAGVQNLNPSISLKRIPSAQIKRAVYKRDRVCQKCGSPHYLHVDHIKPYSLHGASTLENLRLLCFNCNQRERIKMKL